MQPYEFRDLIAGIRQETILEWLDVGEATLRRWKTGKARIPRAVELYLRLKLSGDLGALAGEDWHGFTLNVDGTLTIPFFHRPFTPEQVKAMFFTTQDAWQDKRDVNTQQREIATLRAALAESKKRELFYRRQCQIESSMGLMLARIVD